MGILTEISAKKILGLVTQQLFRPPSIQKLMPQLPGSNNTLKAPKTMQLHYHARTRPSTPKITMSSMNYLNVEVFDKLSLYAKT